MSSLTTRLGLVKETTTEYYSVGTVNDNSDKVDAAVGFEACTSSTRPSAPYNGKGIRESDTGSLLYSNGSSPASGSWKYVWTADGPVIVGAVGTTAPLRGRTTSTLAGNRFLDARKDGESQPGFTLDFDGKHQWGPGGSTAPDTNLYRSAADTLRTDDNLSVGGTLTVTGAVTGSIARGHVVRTDPTTDRTLTGSEVMGDSLTFTATAGRVYKFTFSSRFSLNTNGVAVVEIRVASGASVTTSSTSVRNAIPTGSGSNNEMCIVKSWTAPSSGTFTAGVGASAAAGASSGTLNGGASGIGREFLVEDIGV